MLVFALLYGVRPSSNGPHFAELENEERRVSTYSLVMHLPRVLGARQGLGDSAPDGARSVQGTREGPHREPLKTPPPWSSLPTLRSPGHPESNPTGQGPELWQLEPLSFLNLPTIASSTSVVTCRQKRY